MNSVTFQEEGHLYTNEHGIEVPSVSAILEHFGFSDFSMVSPKVLEAAQDFGTNVHKTTALHDIDDLAECDSIIQPYLEGWIKFKNDYSIAWDDFDLIEVPLYSRVWNFAGTPDRVFGNTLPDIKSGAKMAHHKIQTALYQILVEENYKIKIKKRYGVYLTAGNYKIDPHKDKTDISIAKSLIQLYNFKKREKLL